MGRLAEALRANLKSVAESDARALREIDQELKAATSGVVPFEAQLSGQVDAKARFTRTTTAATLAQHPAEDAVSDQPGQHAGDEQKGWGHRASGLFPSDCNG